MDYYRVPSNLNEAFEILCKVYLGMRNRTGRARNAKRDGLGPSGPGESEIRLDQARLAPKIGRPSLVPVPLTGTRAWPGDLTGPTRARSARVFKNPLKI